MVPMLEVFDGIKMVRGETVSSKKPSKGTTTTDTAVKEQTTTKKRTKERKQETMSLVKKTESPTIIDSTVKNSDEKSEAGIIEEEREAERLRRKRPRGSSGVVGVTKLNKKSKADKHSLLVAMETPAVVGFGEGGTPSWD